MEKAEILGRWRIVRWEQVYDDGRQTFPMGPEPVGFIQYDADDHMTIMIADRRRAPFAGGAQWAASVEEKARAYDGFLSYSGRFDVAGDVIRHHVELAIFPNWQGGVQTRSAAIMDGELHLSGRLEEGTNQARTARIIWRREAC
jgi:hypothetical protein